MIQPDLTSIAEKIVSTCTRVKKGDCVFISARSDTADFAERIAIECTRRGAHSLLQPCSDFYCRENLLCADQETLERTPRHFLAMLKETDVLFQVGFMLTDPRSLQDVPPEKFAQLQKGQTPLTQVQYDGKRKWVGIACPSPAQAEVLGIQWEPYHDSMWNALDVDYDELSERCSRVETVLKGKKAVHITTKKGTDVTIDIEGTPIMRDEGTISEPGEGFPLLNLPSGEVCLPPTTAQGTVVFDYTFRYGRTIVDLKGEFENGIVEFTEAKEGLDFVRETLEKVTGDAYKIAELGIGVNPNLTQYGNIMATEKVNGNVHLALGENRPIGGTNAASDHWDMFMFEPTVSVDDTLLIKDGQLQVKGL